MGVGSAEKIFFESNDSLTKIVSTSLKKFKEIERSIDGDVALQGALGAQQVSLLETARKSTEAKLKGVKIMLDFIGNEDIEEAKKEAETLNQEMQDIIKEMMKGNGNK